MNKKEIFETVYRFLMKQRKASRTSGGKCLYRYVQEGQPVLKCAVGCLISDEDYIPEMDEDDGSGTDIRSVVNRFQLPSYFGNEVDLLNEMQYVHDKASDNLFTFDVTRGFNKLRQQHHLMNTFEWEQLVKDSVIVPDEIIDQEIAYPSGEPEEYIKQHLAQ